MKYQLLTDKEFNDALLINQEYLSASKEDFTKWFKKYPDLFVGAFDDEKLVGICYGHEWTQEEYVILEGIATLYDYWRKGVGSELLKTFESQVEKQGKQYITVGCAPDEKTEQFYLKNLYQPITLLAKIKKDNLSANYKDQTKLFEFVEEKNDGDVIKIYFKAEQYNPLDRQNLQEILQADEVIYIMNKRLQ